MFERETGQRLHQELAECRKAQGFREYPPLLRQRAGQYVRMRRDQGVSIKVVAAELGVAKLTATAWGRASVESPHQLDVGTGSEDWNTGFSIVPVIVRSDGAQPSAARLEVEFRDSTCLRIAGVSIQEILLVVDTLRGQSCSTTR